MGICYSEIEIHTRSETIMNQTPQNSQRVVAKARALGRVSKARDGSFKKDASRLLRTLSHSGLLFSFKVAESMESDVSESSKGRQYEKLQNLNRDYQNKVHSTTSSRVDVVQYLESETLNQSNHSNSHSCHSSHSLKIMESFKRIGVISTMASPQSNKSDKSGIGPLPPKMKIIEPWSSSKNGLPNVKIFSSKKVELQRQVTNSNFFKSLDRMRSIRQLSDSNDNNKNNNGNGNVEDSVQEIMTVMEL